MMKPFKSIRAQSDLLQHVVSRSYVFHSSIGLHFNMSAYHHFHCFLWKCQAVNLIRSQFCPKEQKERYIFLFCVVFTAGVSCLLQRHEQLAGVGREVRELGVPLKSLLPDPIA